MRWILLLVAATAIGGSAWMLLRGDGAGEAPPGDVRERAEEAEGRPVTLTGLANPSGAVDAAHAGRGGIVVLVTRDGKPARAELEARFLAGPERVDSDVRERERTLRQPFALPDPPGNAAAQGTSDESGRCVLSDLAAGIYRVTARAPGGARGASSVALPFDGARSLVTIGLVVSDLVLAGRIEWSDGRPFTGTVVLQPEAEQRGNAFRGRVGSEGAVASPLAADGTFRLEGLAAGQHGLRAHASDGLWVANDAVTLPATRPYHLVVELGKEVLQGRVLDGTSEAPIADATVTVHTGQTNGAWVNQLLISDAEGRFRVNVGALPAQFAAEAPGYGRTELAVTKAGEEALLRLLKTARISGRVVTRDGGAAPGALVVARSSRLRSSSQQSSAADREGRYVLKAVPSGEVTLMVCGGGWISPGLLDAKANGFNPFLHAVPSGASLSLDLTAVPGARIEGRVLDASGAAVGGAVVRAAPLSSSPFDESRGIAQGLGDETTRSDPQGRFVLEGLIPDLAYRLTALAPEQALAAAGPFTVSAVTPVHTDIRFPALRTVDVQVLFEDDGGPVAGARATFHEAQGRNMEHWASGRRGLAAPVTWTTDVEGRARMGPAPPGALFVRVESDEVVGRGNVVWSKNDGGASPGTFPVEGSSDGLGPFALTVRLPRALTIEGRVLRHDGAAAARASVHVRLTAGVLHMRSADADGVFVLRGLPAGTHTVAAGLRVEGQKYLRGTATAEAGARDLTVTLSEHPVDAEEPSPRGRGGPTLLVRVVDDRGRPVPSATVSVRTGGGSNGGDVRDGVASIELGQIAAHGSRESVVVTVWGARGEDGLPLPLGPARVGPLAAGQLEIDVQLPLERALEGRVLSDRDAPLPGVLVTARPAASEDPHSRGATSTGRSDAQGRFRVGGLGEGEHILELSVPPTFVQPAGVTVAAGSTDTVIRVTSAASVRVRVLDEAGQQLAGARVAVDLPMPRPAAGEDMRPAFEAWQRLRERVSAGAVTDADGTARLRGLEPGLPVRLVVTAPAGRDDLQTFTQDGWAPEDLEVRLMRGYVVSGVVRDGAGNPVPKARVDRKLGPDSWTGLQAEPDGTFRLTGLPSGPVTLRAHGPGQGRSGTKEPLQVTVAAGSADVVLLTDPGVELVVRVTNVEEADWKTKGNHVAMALVRRGDRWEHAGSAWDQEVPGRFLFEGMSPSERYKIWIQPRESDWYGEALDVSAGAAEVTVQLKRGGTIRGRIAAPTGAQHVNVQVSNDIGLSANQGVDIEGRYEIRGLPEGRWTVRAYGRVKSQSWQAEGTATTGGTLDLSLQEIVR